MHPIHPNPVTLVLGGVRSGKSRFAQQLASRYTRVTVIATARVSDDDEEMCARIERHRADRPAPWITIEEPLELAQAVQHAARQSDVVLIDCLTLYASNLLEAGDRSPEQVDLDLQSQIGALCQSLTHPPCPIVLVANEVGSGVVPMSALGRRFRDVAGDLNQRIAALADDVVLMVAGLPLVLKAGRPINRGVEG